MDHVEAHVAGPEAAHDGVEVGAVVVELGADFVGGLADLEDAGLEQAQGVGVGQHHRGHVGAEGGLEGLDIDLAVGSVGTSSTR